MSISLWVSNNSTARKSIFYLEYNNSNALLALENNSYADSTALSVLYNNAAIITPAGSTLPTDGSWHHIVVTASATTEVKLYKNGSQIGSTASITVNTNALTEAHIGVRHYNNDLYWDGKIDQVRIFNRAITANEVETLYDEVQCIPTIVPTDYFNTVIYTGNGNDNRSITGVGFEPDFIWLKNSSNNWGHTLVDSVRGLNAANVYGALASDQTAAETTTNPFGAIKTLDIDGFTIKDGTDVNGYYAVNRLNSDYVAWNWKAADTTTTIAANTVGNTIASDVRANQDAGFSIVDWTGDGTVGHGLSQAPEMIIAKRYNSGTEWLVYTSITGATQKLVLNTSAGEASTGVWNSTSPTDSVFTAGSAFGSPAIAYCFHSVDGYSKIGSYQGIGGATGELVYLGFRPRWLMIKGTNTTFDSNWFIWDSERDISNPNNSPLQANNSQAELTDNIYVQVDLNSTGFQIKSDQLQLNESGKTYIFLAIAEEVFNPNGVTRNATDPFGDGSENALYKFEDNATNSEDSITASAPNVTYSAGYIDKAAVFNGSSSNISIGTELIPATSNFSLSFWINRNTSSDSDLFNQATSSGDIRTYFKLYSNGTFGVSSAGTNGSRIQVPNTTSAITNGQWEHIAIVRDGSNMTFYINGTGETETISGGTVGVGRGDLVIGSASASPDGKIDQVRIFNRALDQGEVTQLYNE